MKAELVLYKFLSFLLLPVAVFFGLACLSGLLIAVNYPAMMISVFLIACVVIYIIAAFIFLIKGIDNNKPCKPILRDWIRINGTLTFVFFVLMIISFTMVKMNPSLLHEGVKQWMADGNLPPGMSAAEWESKMAATLNFCIALSLVLLVHVFITFHLMRRYRYLFEPVKIKLEQE